METKEFFQFEIIINVLVISFCLIWIHMLWVYGHYKYFILSAGGPNLYVKIWRLLTQDSVRVVQCIMLLFYNNIYSLSFLHYFYLEKLITFQLNNILKLF